MLLIRVEITDDLIADGVRGSSYSCPVALCLERMGYEVFVDSDTIKFRLGPDRYRYIDTHPSLDAWMDKYDHPGSSVVEPFAFDLDVPDDFPVPTP